MEEETNLEASYEDTLALAQRIVADLQAKAQETEESKTTVASHDEADDVKLVKQAITILRELLAREAQDGDSSYNLYDLAQILMALDMVKFKEELDVDRQEEATAETVGSSEVPEGDDEMTTEEIVAAVTEANKPLMEALAALINTNNTTMAALLETVKPIETPVVEETKVDETVAAVAEAEAIVAESTEVEEAAKSEKGDPRAMYTCKGCKKAEVANEDDKCTECAGIEAALVVDGVPIPTDSAQADTSEVPAAIEAAAEAGEVVIAEVPEADSDGETTVYAMADDDDSDPLVALANSMSDTGRATEFASNWLATTKNERISAQDEGYRADHVARVEKANRVPVGVQEDFRTKLGSDLFDNFHLIFSR